VCNAWPCKIWSLPYNLHESFMNNSWILFLIYSWKKCKCFVQNMKRMHENAWPCMCMTMHEIFTAILTSFPIHEGCMNILWTFYERSCTLFMHMPWTVHERSCIFWLILTRVLETSFHLLVSIWVIPHLDQNRLNHVL